MPCRSDYMESNPLEKKGSIVCALLDELTTGKHVNPKSAKYQGYDDRVYCVGSFNKDKLDEITAELCNKLHSKKPSQIKKMSLEMQIWWRDHQKADKMRIKIEREEKKKQQIRQQALAKLTPAEIKALDIER